MMVYDIDAEDDQVKNERARLAGELINKMKQCTRLAVGRVW